MALQFTIADLRSLVARGLAVSGYEPTASARVRDVPDTRTIRYYTTLGLLDRPAEMRGRTAFYDRTHVLQLVAIKRLQAENLTLSDIQSRLTGLPPKSLAKIANLPAEFWEEAATFLQTSHQINSAQASTPETDVSETEFWATVAATPHSPNEQRANINVRSSVRIRIHSDVEVIVDVPAKSRPTVDVQRLREATDVLLAELRRQGLLP